MAATREKQIVIRLSPARARLLAQNIDGWRDAGECEFGLTEAEKKALDSAYSQIMRQIVKPKSGITQQERKET